jgi:hypothetical protein
MKAIASLVALLGTLGMGGALGAQDPGPDPNALEAQAKEKIATFKKTIGKAKTEEEFIFALQALGKTKHPKLLQELKRHIGHPSERVRRYVIAEVAAYRPDGDALKILVSALTAEAAKATQDDHARDIGHDPACEVLRNFRGFRLDKDAVSKVTSLFRHANLMLASTAVRLCGEWREYGAVEPMLSTLREAEAIQAERPQVGDGGGNSDPSQFVRHSGSGGGSAPSSGPKMTPEQARQMGAANRKHTMTAACKGTLEVLLGERRNTSQEYAEVWAKNRERLIEAERKRREEEEGP